MKTTLGMTIIFFCLIYVPFLKAVELQSSDAISTPSIENNARTKKIVRNVLIGGAVITAGIGGFYVMKRLLTVSEPVDDMSDLEKEELDEPTPFKESPTLPQPKHLSPQAYDAAKYKLVNINENINPQATQDLKDALATNNFPAIKAAICNGALNHSDADKLWWHLSSANAAYYFVENYPRDKKELLEQQNDNLDTHLQAVIKSNNNSALAEALINLGADINVAEFATQRTPLILAATNEDAKIFVLLIEKGADTTNKDAIGKTVWSWVNKKFIKAVQDYKDRYPAAVDKINEFYELRKKKK